MWKNEREVRQISSFALTKSLPKLATKFRCIAHGLSLNQTKFRCHLGEISHPHEKRNFFFPKFRPYKYRTCIQRHSGVRYFTGVCSGTNMDFQQRVKTLRANRWSLDFRGSSSYEQNINSEYESDKPSSESSLTLTSKEVRSPKGKILLSVLWKKKMGLMIQSEDYLQQWWVYLKKSPGSSVTL